MQLVGIQIYNLDIARIKTIQRNEIYNYFSTCFDSSESSPGIKFKTYCTYRYTKNCVTIRTIGLEIPGDDSLESKHVAK